MMGKLLLLLQGGGDGVKESGFGVVSGAVERKCVELMMMRRLLMLLLLLIIMMLLLMMLMLLLLQMMIIFPFPSTCQY